MLSTILNVQRFLRMVKTLLQPVCSVFFVFLHINLFLFLPLLRQIKVGQTLIAMLLISSVMILTITILCHYLRGCLSFSLSLFFFLQPSNHPLPFRAFPAVMTFYSRYACPIGTFGSSTTTEESSQSTQSTQSSQSSQSSSQSTQSSQSSQTGGGTSDSDESDETNTLIYILIPIIAFVLVVAVVVCVLLYCCCWRKKKNDDENAPITNSQNFYSS